MDNNAQVIQIPIEDIMPNRFQPRISFDQKALEDLAKSIKQHGIIQPLVVRKLGDKYEIIAGERRYKASQLAGLIKVPAIVSEMTDQESAEVALVENVQRQDLSAIEEARSYKNILDNGEMTQDELAKKMGLSQSSVANKLRLLNLSDDVQKAVLDGKISERHARSLLQVEDQATQKELLNRVIDERLTVRQLDTIIKDLINPSSDDEDEDVPLVDINENLEKIKNEATDINSPSIVNTPDSGLHQNRFFVNTTPSPSNNNPMDKPITQNDQSGFFDFVSSAPHDLDNLANESINEAPVSNDMTEELLDEDEPVIDTIETLDDTPSIFGGDYTTKINKVRDFIKELNVNDDIELEELDMPDTYKINITIKKDS